MTCSGLTGTPNNVDATSATALRCSLALALGGHRGRGADALDVRRVAGVLEPPDQQRHVRALPAAVGVQLVQDEEPQALGRLDQAAVVRAG